LSGWDFVSCQPSVFHCTCGRHGLACNFRFPQPAVKNIQAKAIMPINFKVFFIFFLFIIQNYKNKNKNKKFEINSLNY